VSLSLTISGKAPVYNLFPLEWKTTVNTGIPKGVAKKNVIIEDTLHVD